MKKHNNKQKQLKLEKTLFEIATEADKRQVQNKQALTDMKTVLEKMAELNDALQEEIKNLREEVMTRDETISVLEDDVKFWQESFETSETEKQGLYLMPWYKKFLFIFKK